MKNETHVYLLAWKSEEGGDRHLYYEVSTVRIYRMQHVIRAGIERGNRKVTAFSDYIHGNEPCNKEELMIVAKSWLDEDYTTIRIDLSR